MAPPNTWLVGQIVEFHPESHTYTATAGKRVFQGISRLLDHPGDVTGLQPETLVAIHNQLGEWVIAGILNQRSFGQAELAPVTVTELSDDGANDPTVDAATLGDGRARNAASDVSVGSWARTGPEGQLLALLSGGTVILKAAPLAQIRAHQQSDTVEIISHLFRHITAMGEAAVTAKKNGGVLYTWRGGAHVADCGPDSENWTIQLDVGAQENGDIFNFRITTPAQQVLSRVAMTPTGDLELRGTSFDMTAGPTTETFTDDKQETVDGKSTLWIGGAQTVTVEGSRSLDVSSDSTITVGANQNETINGDKNSVTSGSVHRKIIGGLPPFAIPTATSKAEVVEYINGSVEVALGNPFSGAIPTANQSAQWVNYVGGFNFVLMPTALPAPLGGFNVISPLPLSVNLGCDGAAVPDPTTGGHIVVPVPAPFGVMKFEPFMVLLQGIITWCTSHVHGTAVGPSTPPLVPADGLMGLAPPIRSLRVGVGL